MSKLLPVLNEILSDLDLYELEVSGGADSSESEEVTTTYIHGISFDSLCLLLRNDQYYRPRIMQQDMEFLVLEVFEYVRGVWAVVSLRFSNGPLPDQVECFINPKQVFTNANGNPMTLPTVKSAKIISKLASGV